MKLKNKGVIHLQPEEFREIRERLKLTPEEFAHFLGLAGYGSIMNIENGIRRPNKFVIKFLRFLSSLSVVKAKHLIEEINKHDVH
jgi:DNA-binding transcriptional regulator YiaG